MDERFLKQYLKEITPPKRYVALGWIGLALLIVSIIVTYFLLHICIARNVFYKPIILSVILIIVGCVLIVVFGEKVSRFHEKSFINKIEILQTLIKQSYYDNCKNTIGKLNDKIRYNVNSELKKVTELLDIYEEKFQEVRRKKKLIFESISVIISGVIIAIIKAIIDCFKDNIDISKMIEYGMLIIIFAALYFMILYWVDKNLLFFEENNLLVLINSLKQYKVMLVGEIEEEQNIIIPKVIKKVEVDNKEYKKESTPKNKLVEINVYGKNIL